MKKKGSMESPRLRVFKSNQNIYCQIINDEKGETLAASSTLQIKAKLTKDSAFKVGEDLAEKAKKNKIKKVFFDRGKFIYTGRVKALADGARKGGLEF